MGVYTGHILWRAMGIGINREIDNVRMHCVEYEFPIF